MRTSDALAFESEIADAFERRWLDEAMHAAERSGQLAHYELIERVGEGSFGIVWKAFDPSLRRNVAIKVIHHIWRQHSARFEREGQAAARLNHPNIVRILQVAHERPLVALVYEFIDGPTLSEWLKAQPNRRAEPRTAARILSRLADAMAHAHEHDVLHRDIKPQNVLMAMDALGAPSPRLTDFGLARLTDSTDGDGFTATDAVIGTAEYMSPEQAEGRVRDIDVRSDVDALGATLYAILSGRPPFQGTSAIEVRAKVPTDRPTSLSAIDERIPRDLETICLKCLNKEPRRRYQSAAELRDDLNRFLAGELVKARRTSMAEYGWSFVRKRPALTALAGLFVSVVAGLALGLPTYFRERAESAKNQERLTHREQVDAVQSVDRLLKNGQVLNAQAALNGIPRGPVRSGFVWGFLRAAATQHVERIGPMPSVTTNLFAQSADRKRWAFRDALSGKVHVWNLETLREIGVLDGDYSTMAGMHLCEDGNRLAIAYDHGGKVAIWDVASRKTIARLDHFPPGMSAFHCQLRENGRTAVVFLVGPSGQHELEVWGLDDPARPALLRHIEHCGHIGFPTRLLAFARWAHAEEAPAGTVMVEDVRSGKQLHKARLPGTRHEWLVLSTDGKLAAACVEPRRLVVWDLEQDRAVLDVRTEADLVEHSIIFSPRNDAVTARHRPDALQVYDLNTKRAVELSFGDIRPHPESPWVSFSPEGDGVLIGYARKSSGARRLVRWNFRTDKVDDYAAGAGEPAGFDSLRDYIFTPDGRSVLVPGSSLDVWHFMPKPPMRALEGPPEVWSLAFTPDGSKLIRGGDDGDKPNVPTIQVWDVASETLDRSWVGHTATVSAVAVDPRTRLIASASLDRDGDNLKLWRLSGQMKAVLSGHRGKVKSAAFSPRGGLLATGGVDGTLKLWDIEKKTYRDVVKLSKLPDGADAAVFALAFSPDGHWLAAACEDFSVHLWEGPDWTPKPPLRLLDHPMAVAFSPDSAAIAVADKTGAVTLWSAAGSRAIGRMNGDQREQRCLAFSPDGQTLAAGGVSSYIHLWDTTTGIEILTLESIDAVHALAFSADGRLLASGGSAGRIQLWKSAVDRSKDRR